MKILRGELRIHRVLAAVLALASAALIALPAAAQEGGPGGRDGGAAPRGGGLRGRLRGDGPDGDGPGGNGPGGGARVAACDLQNLMPGLNRNCSIDVSGTRRVFDVVVPMNVGRNAPITLDFHAQ